MRKRTQKFLVYLDQNFLSNMSKADINEKVRPEFKDISELLHQGFVDEKVAVPLRLQTVDRGPADFPASG
jgi:hypothetical protein